LLEEEGERPWAESDHSNFASGHQPTVATGSFLASCLIEIAAEPSAI
jgi:hypothetical protein